MADLYHKNGSDFRYVDFVFRGRRHRKSTGTSERRFFSRVFRGIPEKFKSRKGRKHLARGQGGVLNGARIYQACSYIHTYPTVKTFSIIFSLIKFDWNKIRTKENCIPTTKAGARTQE
jgi:hypothetical protein